MTDDFCCLRPLADVIILAVPIKQNHSIIKDLAELNLKGNVIISDAGSTKAEIVAAENTCNISPSTMVLKFDTEVTRPEPRQPMSLSLKMPIIFSRPLA